MNKLSIESNKPNLIKNQNNWSSNEKKTVPVIKFQSVDGQKQCKFSVYLITQKCKRVARCPNQHESLQNLHVRCFVCCFSVCHIFAFIRGVSPVVCTHSFVVTLPVFFIVAVIFYFYLSIFSWLSHKICVKSSLRWIAITRSLVRRFIREETFSKSHLYCQHAIK